MLVDEVAGPTRAGNADPVVLFPQARARRRRRRQFFVVLIVMAIAAAIVFATRAGSSAPDRGLAGGSVPAGLPAPTRYQAIGTIVFDHRYDKYPQVCAGLAESLPPGCGGGVPLIGLNLSRVPSITTMGPVTFSRRPVRVIGTYKDGRLTLTSEPVLAGSTGVNGATPINVSCPPPSGGWVSHRFDSQDAAFMMAYGEVHAGTFGGFWAADQEQVGVVATTGDVAAARHVISAGYKGNLCVLHVRFTEAQLVTLQGQLSPAVGQPNALRVNGSYADLINNRVVIDVTIDNETVEKYLKDRGIRDEVAVEPFLTVAR